MPLFQVAAIVITLVSVFGYINHKLFKLPDAIGITAIQALTIGRLVRNRNARERGVARSH